MKPKRVLITIDFSKYSLASIQYARKFLLSGDEEIVLLSVVQNWPVPEFPYCPNPEYAKDLVDRATNSLREISSEYLGDYKGEVTNRIVSSLRPVAAEIAAAAEEEKCDAVIMAGMGAGAVAGLLIGSTVQKVVQLAHCPVLIIPKYCLEMPGTGE